MEFIGMKSETHKINQKFKKNWKMFRKPGTLGTWVSEIFQLITIVTNLKKRHSCLLLLPSYMNASGLFYFVSFVQDCKSLANTMG